MVTVDGDCRVNKSDKKERLYQRGTEGGGEERGTGSCGDGGVGGVVWRTPVAVLTERKRPDTGTDSADGGRERIKAR